MAGLGLKLGIQGNGIAGTKIGAGGATSQKGNPLGRVSNIALGAYTGNYMQMAQGIAGDTPAGKGLSLYSSGTNLANKFSSDPGASGSGSSSYQNPWTTNSKPAYSGVFGGGQYEDALSSMNRRMQSMNSMPGRGE